MKNANPLPHAPATPALGIDIGRVIIGAGHPGGREDTSFIAGDDEAAMTTPPMPGALEVIPELVDRFAGNVYLVSKAGPRVEDRSRRWLRRHRFHELTGIPESSLRFCRQRPEKRDIAVDLGLTHFLDDRLDVLEHLRGAVPHLYRFGAPFGSSPPGWYRPLPSWAAVRRVLFPGDGLHQEARRHAIG